MQKTLLKRTKNLAVFLILLVVVGSCRKDHLMRGFERQEPSQLKQWYANFINKQTESFFLTTVVPDWKNVYESEHDGQKVYEVDCNNTDKVTFGNELTTDQKKADQSTRTKIKLLLFEAKDGRLSGAFMLVKEKNAQTQLRHYKNLGKLNGEVIFYSLEGIFANGWIYENGEIKESITRASKNQINALSLMPEQANKGAKGKVMLADVNCIVVPQAVYSQQCITIEPIPEQGGSSTTTCTWVISDIIYSVHCTNTGGDGTGGPGGNGSGGGYIPPDVPPTEPPADDPCAKAKTLNENTNYKDETNTLKTKVDDETLKKEVGYVKKTGSPAVYKEPTGTGLEFPIPQPNDLVDHSLEYFNHTHYKDSLALSTFSFDDFFTFAKFLGSSKIADKNSFTVGVTTGYGTYALMLGDWSKFSTYLQNTINDFWPSNTLSQTFRSQESGVHESNTGIVNERNLLRILKDSGINLLKKESSTGAFKVLKVDANGTVQVVDCPGTMIE